jgi:hypothetical protein
MTNLTGFVSRHPKASSHTALLLSPYGDCNPQSVRQIHCGFSYVPYEDPQWMGCQMASARCRLPPVGT